MKRYSTVIFDLDGTLLDTLEDLTDAVNQALRECGYPEHTMEEIKSYVGNGMRLLVKRSLPREEDADPEAFEMILQSFKSYYSLHGMDATAPYPGVPELLTALGAAGCKVAVVSNKGDASVKQLCGHYFPAIDQAVGEQEGVRRKPEPDTLFRVMALLGATPGETLYVGDSDVDILTAQNAGVDCASVTWGFRTEESLRQAGATALFATAGELQRWILGNERPTGAQKTV